MGRIEHTLLDGEFSVRPNRPKTFARNPTIPHKVTDVSIYGQGTGPLTHRRAGEVSVKSRAGTLRRIPPALLSCVSNFLENAVNTKFAELAF